MNDGSGHFTDSGQTFGSSSGHGVALGDLDGDVDLDAFLAFMEAPSWVLRNNGTGSSPTPASASAAPVTTWAWSTWRMWTATRISTPWSATTGIPAGYG